MKFRDVAEYYQKLESISSRLEMIAVLSEMLSNASHGEIKNLVYMTQGVLSPPFEGIEIGIADKFAQHAVAMATGYTREQVADMAKRQGDLGLVAEELTAKTKLRRMGSENFDVNGVFRHMLKIASTSGAGSQEAKIKMMVELIAASTPKEAKYLVRFAIGTLRLGAGDATILEALSKMATGERTSKDVLENAYNICSDLGRVAEVVSASGIDGARKIGVTLFSPIRPALAERLPEAKQILDRMHGKCAVESKYDGLRAQVHLDRKAKRVEIFSRNLERITAMLPEIGEAALEDVHADTAIIEGEAIAYDEVTKEFRPFQETIQRKRKHGVKEKSEEMPLHLFAFDLMYLDGEDYLLKPYSARRKALESIIKRDTILLSDRIIATEPAQLEKYFDEAVEEGLEGIVAKDLESPYIAGARKFSWIKLKRSYKGELSDTLDLVIVGYFLGRGTRAAFQFGGLLAATYNKKRDMFETITRIGTGFSEEQMKSFKRSLDRIKVAGKPARVDSLVIPDFWVEPKYVVTVRADEITRSPMHTCGRPENGDTGYALRFPRIVSDGIREDKGPDDATSTDEVIEMFGMQRKVHVT